MTQMTRMKNYTGIIYSVWFKRLAWTPKKCLINISNKKLRFFPNPQLLNN